MGISNAIDISVSGIIAERTRLELIASNIANINTTNSVGGGPYKRKILSCFEKPLSFERELALAQGRIGAMGGVGFKIIEDNSAPMQKMFNPGHPDADKNGYVTLPNVSMATEMTDLILTGKMYEANITVLNAARKMNQETLAILQ